MVSGDISLVEQDTIGYVSTAYFDQKKFKSIYYIKELFSADASNQNQTIQTHKSKLLVQIFHKQRVRGKNTKIQTF